MLRCTGGQRRQVGVQLRASTSDVQVETAIPLPQRLDVVWQSHTTASSARVDCRQPSDESDIEIDGQDDNGFESANDPRRSVNIQGPKIGDIDSLEI